MSGPIADGLVQLGERANPKRSFLLVSSVLGKHVPLPAARCRAAGAALALAVAGDPRAAEARAAVVDGSVPAASALLAALTRSPAADAAGGAQGWTVLGFAETATGLTHQVGEALDCAWLQTTTRHPDAAGGLAFEEAHSHAPDQWLRPLPPDLPEGPLVLVDDELSTGATAANLIRALHASARRPRYVVAALVDARPPGPGPLDALAAELELVIDVVALVRAPAIPAPPPGWSGGALPQPGASAGTHPAGDGSAHRPSERAGTHGGGARSFPAGERAGTPAGAGASSVACVHPRVRDIAVAAPARVEREGLDRAGRAAFRAAAEETAAATGPLAPGALVLGCGEHLALPQLAALSAGPGTLSSSTTRSPALVADRDGYPLRDGLAFAHPEAPGLPGYAYNVRAAERPALVVHFAEPAHRAAGEPLLAALLAAGAPRLTAVTLERRP